MKFLKGAAALSHLLSVLIIPLFLLKLFLACASKPMRGFVDIISHNALNVFHH